MVRRVKNGRDGCCFYVGARRYMRGMACEAEVSFIILPRNAGHLASHVSTLSEIALFVK